MLVSLNELKKYVNLQGLTPEEIAHGLTFAGVEVESIDHAAFATKLCIGEVIIINHLTHRLLSSQGKRFIYLVVYSSPSTLK